MEIDIRCGNCNGLLDGEITSQKVLVIDLCSECEETIRKEGYDEGYKDAEIEV